ncbi:MAG: hypothetical protein IPO21_18485 [Bacteroidales bacterium]|nr:hypothetical protein [Bacteroidales bacterium]
MVRLIHADNGCNTYGMCWKPDLNTEYSDVTAPAAQWEESTFLPNLKTGLRCWNVSTPGTVITYQFNNTVCPPSPVIPYVKLASGELKKSSAIDACSRDELITLSPLPNTSTGWKWVECHNFSSDVDTFSNSREITISKKNASIFENPTLITAFYEDTNRCFYKTNYTITYRDAPQATAFVETENSGWIQMSTVRVCAGGFCNMRAEVSEPSSWKWSGPAGFSANTKEVSLQAGTKQAGKYSITVTDQYGCVGSKELITLVVDSFPQPVVTAPAVCGAKPVTISLTNTTGTVRWYDAAKGGKMVGTGNTFTTPANTKSTSYFYEQSTIDTLHLGPVDTTIGIGYYEKSDYGENGSYMLVFEAAKPFLLKSFKIYSSQNTGDKTFSFFDYSAQNINTTVPMNLGEKRINVNWWVKPGSNYSISSIHSQMYTNTTGVTFPYTNSLASITQSWGGTTAENSTQYLFYYDWIMVSDGCIAPRVKVEAIIDTPTVASFTISADTLQWPKTTVSVINTSTNATTSQWNFGDNSMNNSLSHQYTDTGKFTISLKTTNGNCNSFATKTATVVGDVSKQTINLTKGWNIISTGRFPLDSTVKTMFAGLDVIEVKTMDAFLANRFT